jgi:hypothetical protein
MLRVDYDRWGQTPEDLRQLATSAAHQRTRERFLALYEITQASCATQVAMRTRRHPQTVMEWLHLYNTRGPEALAYRRTGGRPPFAQRSRPVLVRLSAPPSRPRRRRRYPRLIQRRAGPCNAWSAGWRRRLVAAAAARRSAAPCTA